MFDPNPVFPAKEDVKESPPSSFRGVGIAREPGTYEHRTSNILEIQVFLGSGLGPSGRPGMTFLEKSDFFTRSKAGAFAGMTRQVAPIRGGSATIGVALERRGK